MAAERINDTISGLATEVGNAYLSKGCQQILDTRFWPVLSNKDQTNQEIIVTN